MKQVFFIVFDETILKDFIKCFYFLKRINLIFELRVGVFGKEDLNVLLVFYIQFLENLVKEYSFVRGLQKVFLLKVEVSC